MTAEAVANALGGRKAGAACAGIASPFVHRMFLARYGQGAGRATKMMPGPCRSGAVRLGPIGGRIETELPAIQASLQAARAALSTSGLRTLELAADVRDGVALDSRRTSRAHRPPAERHGLQPSDVGSRASLSTFYALGNDDAVRAAIEGVQDVHYTLDGFAKGPVSQLLNGGPS